VVTPARSVIPSVADALLVASALLVDVTVMLPGEFGATYVAVVAVCALNVPLDAVQVTPAPATSLVTVAVKPRLCPSVNPPRFGVTVILTGPVEGAAVTVIVAPADFVVSLTDVAVNVTVAGLGTLTGAV